MCWEIIFFLKENNEILFIYYQSSCVFWKNSLIRGSIIWPLMKSRNHPLKAKHDYDQNNISQPSNQNGDYKILWDFVNIPDIFMNMCNYNITVKYTNFLFLPRSFLFLKSER